MKTRLFSLWLLLSVAVELSAYDFKVDGLCYNITNDTLAPYTVEVTYEQSPSSREPAYESLTTANLPESVAYDGTKYRVTSIGDKAFYYCKNLTSVTIPNGVTSIGDDAFCYCSGLTSITIPNSVTSIEESTFYSCTGLTSVTIPNSVTSIGDYAFCHCYRLTSIVWNAKKYEGKNAPFHYSGGSPVSTNITSFVFGDSVQYIPAGLCNGMEKLTSITIPNSVTSIGDGAFCYCSGLTSITIPNSVTSIEDNAFCYCSRLTSITIPNSVTSIEKSTFYSCTGLTSVTIGNGVTYISDYAFSNCSSLTSVTIPNSVTSIGDYAFKGCSGLTSVVWNAKNYKGENAPFRNSGSPVGTNITSFVFGDSVQYIPAGLCNGMEKLTSVTIPNSVTSIGKNAFYDCKSLISVTIPNSVTSIGEWAFYGCESLTSVTIPDSVTSIGDRAFSDCTDLNSVTIGNRVTNIGTSVFRGCNRLTSVIWNAKECLDFVSYRNTPFYCDIYNNSYTYLNFDIRSQITSFVFGDSVQQIPNYLCVDMKNLTSITIGNSVTSIGERVFSGCTSFISIIIPNSVTSIGNGAFINCTGLTSITIGNSVTSIEDNAFEGCKNVETVVFGSAVETIGASAFAGCQSIYEMTIYATKVPTTHENTFTEVGTGATLRVPAGCAKKYKAHPYWGVFNIEEMPSEYTITVTCDSEHGQVSGSGTYTDGSEATITAIPNKGYAFTQWSDGNKDNPRKVKVTTDATYTAEFSLQNYVVSATCDPLHGKVIGGGTYLYGSEVLLMAMPNNGFEFKQWSDGNTANPYSFVAEKDVTMEALFDPVTPIENVVAEENNTPHKVFRDGQVYILRGGKTYTLTGVEVNE